MSLWLRMFNGGNMGRAQRKSKKVSTVDLNRSTQFIEFLTKLAKKSGSSNIDHFFRSGEIEDESHFRELGSLFLQMVMGFEEGEFIPYIAHKPENPDYVPQSEDYYPWALFLAPTAKDDLMQVFHERGLQFLHSDIAGRKNYVVITNFKSISVCDFEHNIDDYEINLLSLYDALANNDDSDNAQEALISWNGFIKDFGPNSANEKKKKRRSEITSYVSPKEASPQLSYVKRFGHMPSFEIPVGYDGKNFQETFKTKNLPFLVTEECDWNGKTDTFENQLIWGDNLSVMRSLPDESIDLIYVDPPFFSGRNYNCIFGDDDEIRTFRDIWDGGLPTYLAWLNARLWEMKRLLKKTGSLFVHLDWHASHYVKTELDKIFGYDNFKNEIVWCYKSGGASKKNFSKKHDTILFYSKSKNPFFNPQKEKSYMAEGSGDNPNQTYYHDENGKYTLVFSKDWWTDIGMLATSSYERIGYPTQKPEELIEKIIKSACPNNGVTADFFSGGGTTCAVAEKLNRKWIGCDVSRIAISVARDRILNIYDKETGIQSLKEKPSIGFTVSYHGAYEKSILRNLEINEYTDFILQCYEAVPSHDNGLIHGYKGQKAVHVSHPKKKLGFDEIDDFYQDLIDGDTQHGIILTWDVKKEVEDYIKNLRHDSNDPTIQIVQVKLVDIDSHEFKGDNIRFLNKPAAVIRKSQKSGFTWIFDATASQGRNNTDIHYYQWDFNFKKQFAPMTKPSFKDSDGDGNPLNDLRRVEYTFPEEGKYKVALRIFDKSGAEAMEIIEMVVSKKGELAA